MQIDRSASDSQPGRCIAASDLENSISDCSDQSGVFGKGNELVGGHGTEGCIVPARERLKGHDPVEFNVEDWLVHNRETIVVDCLA